MDAYNDHFCYIGRINNQKYPGKCKPSLGSIIKVIIAKNILGQKNLSWNNPKHYLCELSLFIMN